MLFQRAWWAAAAAVAVSPAPAAALLTNHGVSSSRRAAAAAFRHHRAAPPQLSMGSRSSWLWSSRTTTTRLASSSSSSINSNNNSSSKNNKKIPVTLLSGFLGTGKTSTLQHLLENKEQLRIGVIVNDVAAVNIDRKLIAASSFNNNDNNDGSMLVELQNGCACCALQDELLFSVEKLITGRTLDAIVIELSGVADPAAVKYHWQEQTAGGNNNALNAEIARVVTVVDAASFGTDYLTWDAAQDRDQWVPPGDDCTGNRKVSELLAEQCEAADLILVNKVDLLVDDPAQLQVACGVARALNAKADLVPVEFGRVSPRLVLGSAIVVPDEEETVLEGDSSHSHNHDHDPACSDPDCTDSSHSHDHHHDHVAACSDPDCTDLSHSHEHNTAKATTTDDLGFVNFVYKATRPFHPIRIMNVLNQWPVPIKDTLDIGLLQDEAAFVETDTESPFVGVLRSKGFCWFAPQKWTGAGADAWRHDTAMYWSHAGRHFGVSAAGKWWGSMPDGKMRKYFVDNQAEYERIQREDFQTEEWRDRRQEIVFIGTRLNEDFITATLNACLYTDREMDEYRQKLRNYMDTLFTSPVAPSQGGLFDVGGVDHMDLR